MELRNNVLYNVLYDENAELDFSFLDEENLENIFYENITNEIKRIPNITDQLYLDLACSNLNFIPKVCIELMKRSKKYKDIFNNERKAIALNFFGRLRNEDDIKILVYEILLLKPECDKGKLLKNIGFNMDNSNLVENIASKLNSYRRKDKSLLNLRFDFSNKDTIKMNIVSLFENVAIFELLKEINESEENKVLLTKILSKFDEKEKNDVAKKLEEILANSENFNNSMKNLEESYDILKELKNIQKLKELKTEIEQIEQIEELKKQIKKLNNEIKKLNNEIIEENYDEIIEKNYVGVSEEQKKRRIVFALWHYDYCKKVIPTERKTIDYIIEDIKVDVKEAFYANILLIIQDIFQNIVVPYVIELNKKLQNYERENEEKVSSNISKMAIKKELKKKFNVNTHIIRLTNKYFQVSLENIIVRELILKLECRNEENKKVIKQLLNQIFLYHQEHIDNKLDEIIAICKAAIRKTKNKKYNYDDKYLYKLNDISKIDFKTKNNLYDDLIKRIEPLINKIIDDYFRITDKDIKAVFELIKNLS